MSGRNGDEINMLICYNNGKMPTDFPLYGGPQHPPYNNQTIRPYSVNGYKGVRGEAYPGPYRYGEEVNLENNKKNAYVLIYIYYQDNANKNTFDEILSSFQFK